MNQQLFEAGVAAYQSGDWANAAAQLTQALSEGEVNGRVNHLRGNAFMKLGRYDDAAQAYAAALNDAAYGRKGALGTNRGRALLAAGRVQEAVGSLVAATQDEHYATPYKAYNALGSAYSSLGDVRNAGIAYRNAAIDENNPDPCSALRKLGGCFMDLGRPDDAVEAYRTALDFSTSLANQNAIYGDLALAYVAANRMSEAVDAFDHATADGSYRLTPEAQASYDAARNAVAAKSGHRASETDDLLAAAGYGAVAYDPLDPTGETTGNLMPSPEDTGFFSVSEQELVDNEKKAKKVRRKKKHTGRKVLITILVILVLLCGVGGFGYYRGYGWPMQEDVVEDMFAAKTNQGDVGQYLSSSLSEADATQIVALIPSGTQNVVVSNVQRSMDSSSATVEATLAEGGQQNFTVSFTRDGIGWKVSDFDLATTPAGASAAAAGSSGAAATATGTVSSAG